MSGHVIPVVIISLLFNITKFIAISPLGPELQKIPAYLKFILFFQAFHPLTTTGLAPLCILVFLNYKVKDLRIRFDFKNLLHLICPSYIFN